jgi:hypothetical protein
MVTVDGTITHPTFNRLSATFIVDGVVHSSNASVAPATPPFPPNSVRLTDDDPSELTELHSLTGKIGTGDFSLEFDNGPEMEGKLLPGLDSPVMVSGSGAWCAS